MTDTIRVGIYGASGYAGQNLVELLVKHPHVTLIFATSNTYSGQKVEGTDLFYVPSADVNLDEVDVVFLALPHKASAPIAKIALDAGKRVVDLSADFRFDNVSDYEAWYDIKHPHPELLSLAPYGLPEIHRDKLLDKQIVGVPGCYPTATLLGLYPLLGIEGLSLDAPIIVDAKSGVSGAGRSANETTHFINAYGNIIPYKAGYNHRHVGEIEQEIKRFMPSTGQLIFTPHLVPVDRGLMASIYATLNITITSDKVHSLYMNVYADEPLVNVLPLGQHASFKNIQRANTAEISITPIGEHYVHITSTIDNLRKGASSQAIQCFNLMMGFAETESLV
ncbi:MAG: N-acetyl-gamma-glutamyl-phosphate reductase [Phototrophicaceae bacterium]